MNHYTSTRASDEGIITYKKKNNKDNKIKAKSKSSENEDINEPAIKKVIRSKWKGLDFPILRKEKYC